MANSYLEANMTGNTASTRMTFSCWIKINKVDEDGRIFGAQANACHAYFNGDGRLNIDFAAKDSGSVSAKLRTNRRFRDTNAWYHIVFALDTTLGTADDRIKLWVNGVQETSFETRTNPGQNDTYAYGQSGYYNVGARSNNTGSAGHYFEGYISHAAYVDGSALAPTVFGQTDSTSGIWKFKSPSGVTWGDNGFHLKFENSGNLGLDSSGEGNNFTVNGNLKQVLDTPSDSYATLNGAFNLSDNVLSYGNNKALNSNSNWKYVPATLGVESGKWYAEYKVNKSSGYIMNGVVDMAYAVSQDQNSYTHSGAGTGSVSIYSDSGEKYIAGSNTTYAGTYTTNDIIGVALDMDNSKVYFSKNGAWANGSGGWGSSTFDAAVGAISLPTTGTYTFAVSQRSGAYNEVNFGNGLFGITAISSAGSNGNGSSFEYDVPSGFYALNTKNINTYG